MENQQLAGQFQMEPDFNGRRVTLANYGANCGPTGPQGVTAELVLWDPDKKPDVTGKIVVFRPCRAPMFGTPSATPTMNI